ncbi:hypothetical protein TorRG33x02_061410 [Trema orientale]|uniref:Uncharacterized protein n=1 Tax=Trema orientale TaxID=63057 RepID=A0A2P5FJW3_TREOI|nr:hypothetical protein TorRG33x02_061410 [Trema orientale]
MNEKKKTSSINSFALNPLSTLTNLRTKVSPHELNQKNHLQLQIYHSKNREKKKKQRSSTMKFFNSPVKTAKKCPLKNKLLLLYTLLSLFTKHIGILMIQ